MCRRLLPLLLAAICSTAANAQDAEAERRFESHVRPLLIERCQKCHSGDDPKGGLSLDSRDSVLRGGDSGPAIVPGRPDDSLLLLAVRHQNGLEMPPDGKLTETQIAALADWISSGAVWPGRTAAAAAGPADGVIAPAPPDTGDLATSLQLWLRADALALDDGEPVHVWPDHSGHGRDVTATKGIRPGGTGGPAHFARESTLMRRPAVRFDTATGLASSPDNPVDIHGDAPLTIILVLNLHAHAAEPPIDAVFGIGNPAHAGDPGRPLAALVQVNRGEDHALHLAGGFNHDAALGPGSFKLHLGKPTLLSIVKQPGPIRTTTQFFINGVAATSPDGASPAGSDAVPDFQPRTDVGAFLGKALDWCGAIQGDIGEVILYDTALSDHQRVRVELHLADKFGLWLDSRPNVAPDPTFTPEERSFWAYQPVHDPPPPAVRDEAWIQSPVDRFILRALEERGLTPARPADKLTLLRRVTFDLTGLPPTPEEVAAFLADGSPQPFEAVVERLLDSPHYGERWGRHWLDVVRYAESTANDANAVMRYAWRYRNYVIDAFNRDLPYDQFLIEQLAGDLLPPTDSVAANARRIIATGYLMVGPKALAETDKEQSRLDIVDDQIDVTGRAMLGLTLACARCHDHKFDAVRTTDYYALAGIFRSTEPFQDEVRNATMWWEYPVPQGDGLEPIEVMAPKEALPRNLRVHLRGNRFTLGAVVPRGVLQVIGPLDDGGTGSVDPRQSDSGRLQLAQWIASPRNPLTARVMVNRIWQHHFGRGLVATSDNFGTRGERPTHPELLDWLASRFVESGWSVKAMHRLIVLSSAYQQSDDAAASTRQLDPDRRWCSSFGRRRLSAEELRDAMLTVSGQLDPVPGTNESGEALWGTAEDIKSKIRPNRLNADDAIYSDFRKRSIYLPVVRNMLPDVLALFDAADPNNVTAVRNDTTVASQSLFLLNSPFVWVQSRAFAERLLADAALTDDERIVRAHALAYGRQPSQVELGDAHDFLRAYQAAQAAQARPERERRVAAWQSYCQALLCANEFLYVE